jgi:tetratricopeptide (TPR) repeat protein
MFLLFILSAAFALSLPNADTFSEKMEVQNAQNMFQRAFSFYCSNETGEMIDAYNELIDKFEYSTNKEIRLITAQAMSNLALAYESVNNTKAEQAVLERLISKFLNSNDSAIELMAAKSLLRKGFIAANANDTKGEIETGERFVAIFENTDNEDIQAALAGVMTLLGYNYTRNGEYRKAIDIHNKFIDKFENSHHEYMQNQLFINIMWLGLNYVDLGEIKSGLTVYQKMIDKFKNSTNPDIIKGLGTVVANKIELEICNDIKPSFSDENRKIAGKSEYGAFMYEFLQILYDARNESQSSKLKTFKEKYANIDFKKLIGSFDFSDLDRWQNGLKSPAKERVKECVDILKWFMEK